MRFWGKLTILACLVVVMGIGIWMLQTKRSFERAKADQSLTTQADTSCSQLTDIATSQEAGTIWLRAIVGSKIWSWKKLAGDDNYSLVTSEELTNHALFKSGPCASGSCQITGMATGQEGSDIYLRAISAGQLWTWRKFASGGSYVLVSNQNLIDHPLFKAGPCASGSCQITGIATGQEGSYIYLRAISTGQLWTWRRSASGGSYVLVSNQNLTDHPLFKAGPCASGSCNVKSIATGQEGNVVWMRVVADGKLWSWKKAVTGGEYTLVGSQELYAHNLFGGVAGPCGITPVPPLGRQPNFVVIVADDQDLGSVAKMPFVGSRNDWFKFKQATVNVAVCCPSRATMLNGLYDHRSGVIGNEAGQLFDEKSSVATLLKKAGYKTALFGKYLNNYPWDRGVYIPSGWDQWQAFSVTSSVYYNYTLNENGTLVNYGSRPQDYSTDVLSSRVVNYLNTVQGPFFVYYAPSSVHMPYTPAERHQNAFQGISIPHVPSFNEADVSDKPLWVKNLPLANVAEMDESRRLQYRMGLALDESVKAIHDTLQQRNLLKDTIIIYISDNGYNLGEHRHQHHKLVPYEEALRVPLLIHYPYAPAREVEDLVSNVDLVPTLLDLAGVSFLAPKLDGLSWYPLFHNPIVPWRDATLHHWGGNTTVVPDYWAIRTKSWKYIEITRSGFKELYDLKQDPYELNNLANKTQTASIQTQLDDHLERLKIGSVLCQPGAKFCSGQQVMECKADGTGWQNNLVCTAGQECKEGVCEAVPNYCIQNGVARCSILSGGKEVCQNNQWVSQSCGEGERCSAGQCVAIPNFCSGSQDGQTRCTSTGARQRCVENTWLDDACSAGKECVGAGVCQDIADFCGTNGQQTCKNNQVMACMSNRWQLVVNCTASQYCEATGQTAVCKNYACTTGQAGTSWCSSLTTVQTCSGDAKMLTTQNCNANQVCNNGSCVSRPTPTTTACATDYTEDKYVNTLDLLLALSLYSDTMVGVMRDWGRCREA